MHLGFASYPFSPSKLTRIRVYRNQFHDVLPGTSIGAVYLDTAEHYAEIEQSATKLIADLTRKLLGDEVTDGSSVAVVNSLGWARKAVLELPITPTNGSQVTSTGRALGVVYADSYSVNNNVTVDFSGSRVQ